MNTLKHLFDKNIAWANATIKNNPEFFPALAKQQKPEYLWIGCSDSRVPANQIIDLLPGEMVVHRNIANVVAHNDINCLSVIQYAVEALKVKHIIVCGHYGCGGVKAALENQKLGLIDHWLKHIKNIANSHAKALSGLSEKDQHDLLCELNVQGQVENVCNTQTVQQAWENGGDLTVHGWIYNIENGMLKDLDMSINSINESKD